MLITAQEDAPRGYSNATFVGRSKLDGKDVVRPCRLASVAWPIPDSWGEIPSPRLLADVPVSVSGFDRAPLTIAAKTPVVEARVGEKLTIPLVYKRTSEFSGDKIQMRAIGAAFEKSPGFDLPIKAEGSQAVLDLGALKIAPGEYLVSFLGGAVVKYRHQPESVAAAEAASKKISVEVKTLEAEVKKVASDVQAAPPAKKEQMVKAMAAVNAKMKAATDALNATKDQLKRATEAAQPRDIADIVVCEPITIRVKPMEKK
jgi:cell division protein FtsB